MSGNVVPFNPLDKQNLGASVAEAMLARPVFALGAVPDFLGAGIYAIYYSGGFPAYLPLAERNRNDQFDAPIYVGKAVPAGARMGTAVTNAASSRALASRLRQHAESVRSAAPGLDIADFHCRFLVVDDIWIPLGESLLISKFTPIWNSLIDGFGNHDPGRGRYNGMRPRWDVLHPGRAWASKCGPRVETADEIVRDVETYLRNTSPPMDQQLVQPNPDQP